MTRIPIKIQCWKNTCLVDHHSIFFYKSTFNEIRFEIILHVLSYCFTHRWILDLFFLSFLILVTDFNYIWDLCFITSHLQFISYQWQLFNKNFIFWFFKFFFYFLRYVIHINFCFSRCSWRSMSIRGIKPHQTYQPT